MDVSEKPQFLLAEDSENDAFLMQTAFKKAALTNLLHVVSDGEEVIAYLEGRGRYQDRQQYPLPMAVLLDLKMPRKSGFEVLEWIRKQPTLKRMIVIVLTASNRRVDADRAYDLGANFYLTKPSKFDELVEMTRCLYDWLRLNHFPSIASPSADVGQNSRASDSGIQQSPAATSVGPAKEPMPRLKREA